MTLPNEVGPFHKAAMDGMSKLSGLKFDMAYIKGQLADHALMIEMLEKQEKSGKDQGLHEYVARMNTVIKRHYEMARKLDEKMYEVTIRLTKSDAVQISFHSPDGCFT